MSETIEASGHCLCSKVSLKANAMNTSIGACHCSTCRQWGGGPLLAVDCGSDVEFSPLDEITVYESSEWAERGFCTSCGSHLFYRLKQTGQYIIPVGIFNTEQPYNFNHQIFIDEKPSYYCFSNTTKDMTGAEVFAMANSD